MNRTMGLCLSLFILSSCGSRQGSTSSGKVILGDNDLRDVTDPRLASAVGRFTNICTGFHLGGGLIITAGHCIDNDALNGRDDIETCGGDLFFEWEQLTGETTAKVRSSCKRVLFREESPERDFALVEVFPVPSEALTVDFEASGGPLPGTPVEAISVPKGLGLSSSGPCTLLGPDEGVRYFHDCDTTDGSSGAPVLSASGLVIGVHNRGSKFLKKNSLTLISSIVEIKDALSKVRKSEGD